MAWPTVWPKFRCERSPDSRSSAETTAALMATLRATSSVITSSSAARIAAAWRR